MLAVRYCGLTKAIRVFHGCLFVLYNQDQKKYLEVCKVLFELHYLSKNSKPELSAVW
jgi:hypothetical protein